MAFNFPDAPVEGQVFAPSGGPSYTYKNGVWRASQSLIVPSTARPKNYIVNPSMQVSQENGSTGGTTAGFYMADQWSMSIATLGAMGCARSGALPTSSTFAALMQSQSANTLAAGSFFFLHHPIEGIRVADLQWGTPQAKPAVVRFALHASLIGTYALAVRNPAGAQSFVAPITVPAVGWYDYEIPVPPATAGTWPKDINSGLLIGFAFAAGSSWLTPTPGQWAAGNFLGVPGMTNGAGANGNSYYVTDVGLYLDPDNSQQAPPFEMPHYSDELALCQRYWQTMAVGFSGNATSGSAYYANAYFPTTSRTAPVYTGVIYGGVIGFPNAVGTLSPLGGSVLTGVQEARTCNASGAATFYSVVTANARM